MEKEIFMYNEKAASECKVIKAHPIKLFVLYISIVCISLFVFPLSFLWLPDFIVDMIASLTSGNVVKFGFFIWEVVMVWGFVWYFKWIKTVYWAEQTAFIKDKATFYAVKITYMTDGNPIEVRESENEMAVLKTEAIVYEKIFDDVIFRLNTKDKRYKKPEFVRDLDKNFKLVADGQVSVIRLDEVSVLKKTENYLYLSYKNYRGKKAVLKVISAYPNLETAIYSTNIQQYDERFPGKVKVNYRMMIIFGVVMAFVFYGLLAILLA